MSRRYTYATCLSWGGDEPTAELEVEVSFSVAWGSPESGRFGPPENYDPGSGSVVEDIRVEKIDGLPVTQWEAESTEYMPGSTVEAILQKLEMDHEEEMISGATQDDDAARDSYLEQAWKDERFEADASHGAEDAEWF
jgi:hypothetical protein